LLALWDQRPRLGAAEVPRPYGYGYVHRADEINAALRSSEPYRVLGYHPGAADRGGGAHGTHVVDIAAGSGHVGPVGLAPQADLVFVHLADGGTGGLANLGDSVRLLEAVDFIRRTADGRPWVVNLSVGRHGGPHDGTTLAELAFEAILAAAPGRFIVQSAGNYFRSRTHASGSLRTGEVKTLTFVTDPADISTNELEIWYSGTDEFLVHVYPPGEPHGEAVPLDSQVELIAAGRVVGRVYHRRRDPNNADNHVDAFLYPQGNAGTWTVTIEARRSADGRFNAWLERDEACPSCQARFTRDVADGTCTTGTLANSRTALVVGAYDAHAPLRPAAMFSSSGPTRDGRRKPDLAAPGQDILAARSAPPGSIQSPGCLVRKSGTSMATPYVTGAVALCLEAVGHRLTAREIRALVLDSVRPQGGREFDFRLGRGYIDVTSLIRAMALAATQERLTERKTGGMDADIDVNFALGLAPAQIYRELLYRPGGRLSRLIERQFDVVARPGQHVTSGPRAGDVIVEVALGRPAGGTSAVLLDSRLSRERLEGGRGPGWYAPARDIDSEGSARELRVLDAAGRMPTGHLLLRPRTTDVLERIPVEHDFDEDPEATTPVPIDSAAAVPPFSSAERARVVQPLLSPKQSESAVAWSRRVHPATSGVSLDEIRNALDSYVDAAAVRAALAPTAATSDAELVERVHQFQIKCYMDRREHDGRAGESTLDSLGLIARVGSGLRTADRGNAKAQERLAKRDQELRTATGGDFSAANWFNRMADPSVFGLRTKLGNGLHVTLLRKLRLAERHLLTLPAFRGKAPSELGTALGLTEKHGGARPSQTESTSVHTFGLAIDIAYRGNPWVRRAESWAAVQRAALLVSGVSLRHASAPRYFSSLGADPTRSTGEIWDELQQRSGELSSYFVLGTDEAALRAALRAAQAAGTGAVRPGESLADAARRWRARITDDRRALSGGDFDNHDPPDRGFLTLNRDLVIALRDHACLVWGAVDLGRSARGSGDMMHFDSRVDGAGQVLTKDTQAHMPASGHPCVSAAGASTVSGERSESGEETTHEESTVDTVKDRVRAAARGWGTDEAAIMSALRGLLPSQMAQLCADGSMVDLLRDELSGAELNAAGAQLARGRVGSMGRDDINRILAAPTRHTFGALAAAVARDVLLGHHEAYDRTGTGTIHGSRCSAPKPASATASDCTEYVKAVLKRGFDAKGLSATWGDVLKQATLRSGRAGLKGTEVMRALQTMRGWEAVFWAPDPLDPADSQSEHPYAFKVVRAKGTYYGLAIDRTKSVLNYRRTNAASPVDTSGIERLRRLQFGVLAARGGTHMAMVVNGAVYEVHWASPATDRNAIEATPLENFAWLSGAIAAPPGDLGLAWRTP
jgi:subtilisin family serine protease